MARRITIPVKGGLYKSVKVDTQQSAGTTISGFDNQIITLDQLRAALGLTNKASVTPPSGGGTSGSLIVAPGLVGGGPLVGTVPLRINKAQAAAMFVGGGDDDGGGSGPPGRKGPQGQIGATGPAGTPGGPRGHAVAIVTEPEDPIQPMLVRGRAGPAGATGSQGPAGRTKIWLPENDYEEPMFVGRAKASTAATSGAFTKIAEQILGVTASTITFSSIPGTYRNLILEIVCQATARSNQVINLFMNNDTAANYDTEVILAFNGGASAAAQNATASPQLININDNAGSASYPSVARVVLLNYAATTWFKTAEILSSRRDSTGSLTARATQWWKNTAAVNRLDLTIASSTFVIGSTFTLYGES